MSKLNVITGATGQLGSHIAEQLRAAGEHVRALVRPGSDTRFLSEIGVELAAGDLADPASIRRAVAGASIVYHCAARVSDWGPWSTFENEIVAGTRNFVAACNAENVGRLLHVSSISVYGHPKLPAGSQITEETPLGQHHWLWDYYPRAKVLAEEEVHKFAGDWTIVRPSWIYGPRDRITIPRVVPALSENRVPIIGAGDNLLNIIYAGDVAAGVILAANNPNAVGQAYNLCSEGEVTQKDLIDSLTDTLELPRITKHVPFFLAMRFAFLKELFARMLRRKQPPTITRRAIYLIGRPPRFSIEKAKAELGWRPRVPVREGVPLALAWYFEATGIETKT
ncbi:MAG: NAD-dependent epimerase/dehydratase family protein [Planctomycetes bacterium]|nr:NAD-dependent epimerase/dehydratase family protein [Planctomycetota bacterium]